MIKKNKKGFKKGFTIIELMVSIAIMSIIMSVALYNQINFNQSVAFSNSTVEIVNDIREVRFKALGVTYSGEEDPQAYGIKFYHGDEQYYELTSYTVEEENSLVLVNPTDVVDFSFDDLRLGNISLSVDNCGIFENAVEVVFRRPNAQAEFYGDSIDNPLTCDSVTVRFEIEGKEEEVNREITIGRTGQISIK